MCLSITTIGPLSAFCSLEHVFKITFLYSFSIIENHRLYVNFKFTTCFFIATYLFERLIQKKESFGFYKFIFCIHVNESGSLHFWTVKNIYSNVGINTKSWIYIIWKKKYWHSVFPFLFKTVFIYPPHFIGYIYTYKPQKKMTISVTRNRQYFILSTGYSCLKTGNGQGYNKDVFRLFILKPR